MLNYKKIHFIGIGGIGMSALARYYHSQGVMVSGSDSSESELIDNLRSEGMNINIGEDANNVPSDIDLLVYTIAIKSDNTELLKGIELANNSNKNKNKEEKNFDKEEKENLNKIEKLSENKINENKSKSCRVLTYPQALGEMLCEKKVIAVCGTHGKTTTTAMVYYALQNAGLDVSMILGSLIKVKNKKLDNPSLGHSTRRVEGAQSAEGVDEYKMTNYIHGSSDWIVIEACEYRRSFLNYNPEIILITNIDADHLDYYKDINDINNAFSEFINKLSENGKLIIHKNEDYILDFKNENFEIKNINSEKESDNLNKVESIICEDIINQIDIKLSVPGAHNRENAKLVIALGQALSLDDTKIKEGLKNFTGTWRRQEYKGEHFGMQCYDDYAHHPNEIRATLQAFREKYLEKKIIACFMPHLYSRTKILFEDFVNAFSDADEVLLLPIYAAREQYDASISSDMLSRELNNINKKSHSLASMVTLKDYLKINSDGNSIVIAMGAGDIYKIYE